MARMRNQGTSGQTNGLSEDENRRHGVHEVMDKCHAWIKDWHSWSRDISQDIQGTGRSGSAEETR